jgi:hypothetical protein
MTKKEHQKLTLQQFIGNDATCTSVLSAVLPSKPGETAK